MKKRILIGYGLFLAALSGCNNSGSSAPPSSPSDSATTAVEGAAKF